MHSSASKKQVVDLGKRSCVLFITARHILNHLHQQCLQSFPDNRLMVAYNTRTIGYIFLGARPFSEEASNFSRQQCTLVISGQLALQPRALSRVTAAIAVARCAVVHHCNFAVICHRQLDCVPLPVLSTCDVFVGFACTCRCLPVRKL